MYKMRFAFIIITFFAILSPLFAQAEGSNRYIVYLPVVITRPNLTGSWSGILEQQVRPNRLRGNTFTVDLSLHMNGDNISGRSRIQLLGSKYYAIMNINGSIENEKINLQETTIIERNNTDSEFHWCIKNITLNYDASSVSPLNGSWEEQNCNFGSVSFQRTDQPFINVNSSWKGNLIQPNQNLPYNFTISQTQGDIQGTSFIQNGTNTATISFVGRVVGKTVYLQDTNVTTGGSGWCIKIMHADYTATNPATLNGTWSDPGCGASGLSGTIVLTQQ